LLFEWGERPHSGAFNITAFRLTFVPYCGVAVDQKAASLVCGNYHEHSRAGALYCARCGDRFLTTA